MLRPTHRLDWCAGVCMSVSFYIRRNERQSVCVCECVCARKQWRNESPLFPHTTGDHDCSGIEDTHKALSTMAFNWVRSTKAGVASFHLLSTNASSLSHSRKQRCILACAQQRNIQLHLFRKSGSPSMPLRWGFRRMKALSFLNTDRPIQLYQSRARVIIFKHSIWQTR